LGDVEEETMLGMMSRVKIVLANIFDTYDENVVVLVTHSDWIIAALMELYPDTLGFVPRNGEIVPVLVEDRRESQKVSKGAKPTKKHSDDYEDEEEPHGKTRAHASKSKSDDDYPTSKKSSGRKSASKSDDDYPTSKKSSRRKSASKSDDDYPTSKKSSGRKSASKSDDDYPTSKKSSKASKALKFYVQKQDDGEEKRKSASLGNALSERIITSLKNFHDHLAKYDDDENDKPSETMTWGE
jgi:hypothetical protein